MGQRAQYNSTFMSELPTQILSLGEHKHLPKIYEKYEKEKKRLYNDMILNNEMASFTSVVFPVHGGMSNECMNYHEHHAAKIAQNHNQRYEDVICYIMCKLSFMILK